MLFSRIISFFALSMTLGSVSFARPAAEQSNLATVQNIVLNLKTTTDTVLPELSEFRHLSRVDFILTRYSIETMISSNNVTEAAVVPLMNQLISAVNNARISVAKLPRDDSQSIEKRQSASDIAALVAEIITVHPM